MYNVVAEWQTVKTQIKLLDGWTGIWHDPKLFCGGREGERIKILSKAIFSLIAEGGHIWQTFLSDCTYYRGLEEHLKCFFDNCTYFSIQSTSKSSHYMFCK